jgi:hypothetical protein
MLATPLTITIDSVEKELTFIYSDKEGSLYRLKDSTEQIEFRIRHSTLTSQGVVRNRHNVIMDHIVYATDTTPDYNWSTSITLTERDMSDPTYLGDSVTGLVSAMSSHWNTIVVGGQ